MPLDTYFGGKGESVMADMKKQYGDKEGERIFYATAAKQGKGKSTAQGRATFANKQ